MKKYIMVIFMFIMMAGPVSASNFVTGMLYGGLLFGGNNSDTSNNTSILYQVPNVSEKVMDPLKIKHVGIDILAIHDNQWQKVPTLEEHFDRLVKGNRSKYVILQVVRIFPPISYRNKTIRLYFTYIDKEYMKFLWSK